MKDMEEQAREIAQCFIQCYFMTTEAGQIIDMLTEDATWSGFPGDPRVYSKQEIIKRLSVFLKDKKKNPLQIASQEYTIVSYNNDMYVVECNVSGSYDDGNITIRRRITLTLQVNEGQIPIRCVQITPILDKDDVQYLDSLAHESDQLQIIRSILQFGMLTCNYDEDFTIHTIDDNLCRMLGYTREELMKKSHGKAGELIYSEDYKMAIANIKKKFDNASEYSCKYRMERKDGSLIWVWDLGLRSLNQDGTVTMRCLIANINDLISLRKERDATFENIPGGVAYVDITEDDFQIRDANDNFFEMIGAKKDMYLLDEVRYTYPDDLPYVKEHLCGQAKQRKPIDVEFRAKVPKEKKIRWYRMVGRYYNQRDEKTEYLCILIDVTDRREAVSLLAMEKERYRIAMRSTADIVYEYVVQKDELTIYPGKTAHEKTIAAAKGTYKNWREVLFDHNLIHPDDRQVIYNLLEVHEYFTTEIRILTVEPETEQTSYEWYQIYATPIYHEDGTIDRILGILRNVEEQRELSAVSDEMKQIFDIHLSNNYERIVKIDVRTGEYKLFSNENGKFYGLEKSGYQKIATAKMAEEFVYQADRERYISSVDISHVVDLLNSGEEEVTRFYRIRGKDGSYRWKCYRYSYFGMDMDTIVMNVQDVHDIRMEEQKNEEANRRILVDALEEAKKANATRKNFITMITKEVRNPLQLVREMSNIPSEELKDTKLVEEHLAQISDAVSYMLRIADDLTEIDQIDDGKISFGHEPMNLHLMLQEMIEEQNRVAESSKVQIISEVQLIEGHTYYGDAFRVRQVIGNMLANSVRFSPDGENVVVKITEKMLDDINSQIMIEVEDMGVHVNEDNFERVYSEDGKGIFRANGMSGESTGFSLMLCKEIVELMGGYMKLQYGNREENYFSLMLPLEYKQESGVTPATAMPVAKEEKPSVDLSPYSILLVQNENGKNRLLGALLRINGARVDLASTAREALAIWNVYAEGSFQAILVDSVLPDMDCGEFASMVRESDKEDGKKIPIIMLSDNVAVEDMKRGYQKGLNGCISKPVDMQRLLQILQVVNGGILSNET